MGRRAFFLALPNVHDITGHFHIPLREFINDTLERPFKKCQLFPRRKASYHAAQNPISKSAYAFYRATLFLLDIYRLIPHF